MFLAFDNENVCCIQWHANLEGIMYSHIERIGHKSRRLSTNWDNFDCSRVDWSFWHADDSCPTNCALGHLSLWTHCVSIAQTFALSATNTSIRCCHGKDLAKSRPWIHCQDKGFYIFVYKLKKKNLFRVIYLTL